LYSGSQAQASSLLLEIADFYTLGFLHIDTISSSAGTGSCLATIQTSSVNTMTIGDDLTSKICLANSRIFRQIHLRYTRFPSSLSPIHHQFSARF
jgi:hypothetical protein